MSTASDRPAASRRRNAAETTVAIERAAVELERVALAVGDATDEHVHRHEAAERLEAHAVVAHGEVAPLDERVAEIAGQVGVLEIGAARRAGALQRDPRRVAARGEAAEHLPQGDEERREPLHVAVLEHSRKQTGDDQPVLERVAEPLGHARPVAEHEPLAVMVAGDDGGVEVQPPATGRRHAVAARLSS